MPESLGPFLSNSYRTVVKFNATIIVRLKNGTQKKMSANQSLDTGAELEGSLKKSVRLLDFQCGMSRNTVHKLQQNG